MSSRIRSEFGSIGERTTGTDETGPQAVREVDPQHVWVDARHAGLLLAWRRVGDWQGRVFWCPPDLGEAALDWIDQCRLRPRD